jgi:predicted nucleic acid-binding protein
MSLVSRQTEKLCSRLDLARLAPRPPDQLAFVEGALTAGDQLLLDTGVYIHQLKGKTPASLDDLVRLRLVNHSVVAVQEMLHTVGVLDPADPRTGGTVEAIMEVLDGIPSHRLHTPTQDVLAEAAVHAGILCRRQGYAKDRRMKALHDCVLFFQARHLGCTLLTANVVDFDFLQQVRPEGRVLFYETVEP